MSGPVKGLLAPGLMEQPQRGLLDLLYPQGWRGGIFGMGNPTGAYLDQRELSRPGVNPGASPMSNRDLARQYAVNIGSGMGTDAGAPAAIGAGLLGTVKMYHGTPHTFDAFDMAKIGTGEGAQAYGHGLYFAENPKVATDYRKTLSRKLTGVTVDDVPLESSNISVPGKSYAHMIATGQYSIDNLIESNTAAASRAYAALDKNPNDQVALLNLGMANDALKAIDEIKGRRLGLSENTKGNLYTVEHPADPEDFLHWDKPLSEQSPHVREAIEKNFAGLRGKGKHIWEDIVTELTDHSRPDWEKSGPAAAAAALKEIGIPGIRYLDQGSRGAGDGTHNYVVFDDKPLKILSRE